MPEPTVSAPQRPWSAADFPDCSIAEDAIIEASVVEMGSGSQIGAGVRISAATIKIGTGSRIERDTTIGGIHGPMTSFTLGDQSMIGFANQLLTSKFSMGDYGQLHNNGLHSGYEALTIGHNCWIGQQSILNCTERLAIGNNVRIGTQSQLWTHVASGELLEGCTLFGQKPLALEDNVWIVGGAVISPGLTLGRNSIIMTGSVLTTSTEPFHTYAGVPARDVTDKLNFWKPQSIDEKAARVSEFISEFVAMYPQHEGHICVAETASDVVNANAGDVIFLRSVEDWSPAAAAGVSLFDLTTKTYLKQRSAAEIDWIRWSVGYRARFVPRDF